ncbi:hypothetical protein [Cryobacterium zhongshanensis]|uniref:Uncharacterized protein n=1 Tax=Cryobacterium zhongshanensis TaxID=2928153 RepID=A0AA41R0A8_9MICO|nr:hypothetical protein [Cryobacterium zhongshanensis]MCI4659668.1 hypothetical protein [Cryobacterium zhongshanensis]
MFNSERNPVLRNLRKWKADPREWAHILRSIDTGQAKPNAKDVKQVLAACQLGSARLVPFDGGFIVKGARHNQPAAWALNASIDHARRVLDRYVSVYGPELSRRDE